MSQTPAHPTTDQAYLKGRVKVVVCMLNPATPPSISSLLKMLQSQSALDHERVSDVGALSTSVQKAAQAIVVLTITDKDEIVSALQFLKTEENRIGQGTVRVMVLSRMNHPKILGALKSRGVHDILDYHVTAKALNLKLKNQLLLLKQAMDRASREEKRAAASEGLGGGEARAKSDLPPQVSWEPAFEHPSDFWIMTTKKNARFVMGRWLIEIFGPGPSAGSWESTDLTWRGEIGWQWKPRDPNNQTFAREKGSWVFFGRVPEFVWQKNLWSFVGKFPTMAFYADGEAKYYRLKCEQGQNVAILENSENAKSMIEVIKATMESTLRLNDETREGSNLNVNLTGLNRPDAKALGFINSTSSAAGPSQAWREHMETEGVSLDDKGLVVPPEPEKGAWGGSNLLEPGRKGNTLGFIDLSQTGARSDATAFESLKLEILVRSKNGTRLTQPIELKLIDYLDGEALFDAPVGYVAKKDFVEMKAVLALSGRRSEVEAHGEVNLVDAVSDADGSGRCLVVVYFPEEVRKRFETIIHLFQERQIEMNHFFRMARGA